MNLLDIKKFWKFDWQAQGADSPCVAKWLPFYLDDNMGAERDDILHLRVGKRANYDANQASRHIPVLFPHCELDWHLRVRYQGDATSHNYRIWCNFAAYRHCNKCNWYSLILRTARLILCDFYTLITEMRVISFPVSPDESQLVFSLSFPKI